MFRRRSGGERDGSAALAQRIKHFAQLKVNAILFQVLYTITVLTIKLSQENFVDFSFLREVAVMTRPEHANADPRLQMDLQ